MREMYLALALSLGLTVLLETLLAFLLGLRRRDLLLVVLVNVITNPVVALLSMVLGMETALPRWAFLIPLEAAAVAVEWLLLKRFGGGVRHPLVLSVLLNAGSFLAGELLQLLF